jgi:hypothetical protein
LIFFVQNFLLLKIGKREGTTRRRTMREGTTRRGGTMRGGTRRTRRGGRRRMKLKIIGIICHL